MHRLALAVSIGLLAMSAHAAGQSPATATATAPAPSDHRATAPDEDVPSATSLRFGTLRVPGQRMLRYQEGMTLDEADIQQQPKGNGDIGTLLRINPAVQFDDARIGSSRQMGEIRPADISIHGGLFHQNLLLVDGVSFNNDLDPGGGSPSNPHLVDSVPSPAQGIALDTDLLERLTVYDSNVPAAFGGFTGGVVDAKTRRANSAFGGKTWFRMSRSVWNELIVPEGNEQAFVESDTWTNQPVYDKYKLGAMLEGRTTRGIGLIGTVSRTRSDIPLRAYSNGEMSSSDANVKEQRRENTSVSLRANYAPTDRLEIGAGITYAPSNDLYFTKNAKDSWFELQQGGPVANLTGSWRGDAWTFDGRLGYSDIDSSRRVDAAIDYWKTWARSEDKNWTPEGNTNAIEGNWGNIDQSTRNITASFGAQRAPLRWGRTEHRLQAGVGLRDRHAQYHRLNDHHSYISPRPTTSCTGPDGTEDTVSCSLAPVYRTQTNRVIAGQGQFHSTHNLYRAGRFDVRVREFSAYVQDDIQLGRVSLRPGLRFDMDDLMDRNTLAPRLAASWDVFGSGDTLVTSGVNRYYGRSLFGMKLREGRENLQTEYARTTVADGWRTKKAFTANNRFETLHVPYSDEVNLGVRQRLQGYVADLKYVRRQGRDEIMRERVASDDDTGFFSSYVYRYVNTGRSDSETVTLAVEMPTWHWRDTHTTARLAADHTDIRRNYANYDVSFKDGTYNRWVRYNGTLMHAYELPQDGFNRPWTARLSTQTRFEALRLSWSNFLRYRAGHLNFVTVGEDVLEENGQTVSVDVIEERHNPSTWTLDSTLEYTQPLRDGQEAYIRVEAQNVFNQRNRMTSVTTTINTLYEPGRTYWLEAGYRF
ncbi:hypothetical protein ABE488_06690 [Luteimonas sp. TWI662]|uniref:TonB-dependent receptor plug domain-containing protein n=1 Tax=Luteimonas sp. TWI662 TaxID=3136789 RepID=UPI003208FC89